MNSTFPFTTPTWDAANLTVKVALCPPGSVTGVAKPLMLKPVPDNTACVTLRGVVPVFVMVTGSALVEPTFALTVRLAGATASEGRGSAMPAHPAQIKVGPTKVSSTRTSFLWREFISVNLPFPNSALL
jgi:hypothetical protein